MYRSGRAICTAFQSQEQIRRIKSRSARTSISSGADHDLEQNVAPLQEAFILLWVFSDMKRSARDARVWRMGHTDDRNGAGAVSPRRYRRYIRALVNRGSQAIHDLDR